MKSQWECVLQNLGEWQGSFTQLSPDGEMLKDIPSLISLKGVNHNQAIHLLLQRFYPDEAGVIPTQPHELVRDFSTTGPGSLFFESGAFSEGSIYFSTGLKFGAEFAFIHADRRMRLVQMFNSNSQLDQLTLIRERRVGTDAPERPILQLDQLLGEWQGEAITLYPNSSEQAQFSTTFRLFWNDGHLIQQVSNPQTDERLMLQLNGAKLCFEQNGVPFQSLLLPDGASATCPTEIRPGYAFFLETAWLLQPHLRQRMIRHYGADGKWMSATFITEQKK